MEIDSVVGKQPPGILRKSLRTKKQDRPWDTAVFGDDVEFGDEKPACFAGSPFAFW